jgi:hypothetical protein
MLKAKSNAKRQNLGLTIPVATRQARKIIDQVMPNVMATVESKYSHDLATDTATVITTVTFPAGHPMLGFLAADLMLMPGSITTTPADSSIVITRKVK